MKKTLSLCLTVIMLASASLGFITSALADEPITLRLWGGVQPEYGYAQLVDNFNQEFKDKGIELEYVRYVNDGDGNLQLDTYLMAGGEIDIFMGYGGTGRLYPRVESNLLLEMTPYLEAAAFDPIEELGEAAVTQYIYDNKYYAVPTKYENSQYWFANVQMFEQAGIELPYDGWTYAEFLQAVEKMTHGEGLDKTYGMYWSFNNNWDMTQGFVGAMNSPFGIYADESCETSAFDRDSFLEAIELIQKTTDGGFAPSLADEKADNLSIPTVFLEGKAAICPTISQIRIIKDIQTYPHDFTTALIPSPVPDESYMDAFGRHDNINGAGDLICVSASTKYPQEAMDFVLWYIKGGMAPLASGGRIPLWKGFDPTAVAQALTSGAEGVLDIDSIVNYMNIEKTKAVTAMNMPKYAQSEINTALTETIELVLYGQADAKTALADLKTRADQLINNAIAAKK